ncbi:TlpA family protein disulfide reductase [Flavobacterium sp.]|uniref:TlpA family protein disulfide reductase n=1 Tax=Flavobacterium sp. TaxID=239 RepID=UPI0028BDF1D5|nr:thioredoxin-like domain-containing protein [Flavobacterium sp.]
MIAYFKNLLYPLSAVVICSLVSCQKEFKDDNFTAYFGGEIVNPNNRYVLLLKDNEVIDSILLDDKNRFFKKMDSLAPGMYTFKHEPEYQYIYFDKNDSLMIRLNTKEFDNSLVFCGRGDLKNNFLIDMFLKNEADRDASFALYDKDYKSFSKSIDSSYDAKKAFYLRRKTEVNWDENFDQYAKAYLDFGHLAKKEIYPIAHKRRTGKDVCKNLPKDYYNYRNDIDYNNEKLSTFVPFVRYLNAMLNNNVYKNCNTEIEYEKQALEYNIQKLNIADTLIKNDKIKNAVLNNIAFMYLLEDQNMSNNQKFFDRYFQLSTDDSKHNEIKKISSAVQHLSPGKNLPNQKFTNVFGEKVDFNHMIKGQTVVFFWTISAKSHFEGAHKKAMELKQKFPHLNFIAVNIDESKELWERTLSNYNFEGTVEIHADEPAKLKDEWVITKLHRTILLNPDGTIKNAFISLFEPDFGSYLK